LRARLVQWRALVAEEPHVMAGDPDGESAALRPRRRSGRWPLLERLRAMTSALDPPPDTVQLGPERLTYFVNPRVQMSSGNALAQIARRR
jgi:hypothetical protein